MKLYYDKRLKDPTYYAQQGIRNGKKTTTRNVKNFGKHSELINPIGSRRRIRCMFHFFIEISSQVKTVLITSTSFGLWTY